MPARTARISGWLVPCAWIFRALFNAFWTYSPPRLERCDVVLHGFGLMRMIENVKRCRRDPNFDVQKV